MTASKSIKLRLLQQQRRHSSFPALINSFLVVRQERQRYLKRIYNKVEGLPRKSSKWQEEALRQWQSTPTDSSTPEPVQLNQTDRFKTSSMRRISGVAPASFHQPTKTGLYQPAGTVVKYQTKPVYRPVPARSLLTYQIGQKYWEKHIKVTVLLLTNISFGTMRLIEPGRWYRHTSSWAWTVPSRLPQFRKGLVGRWKAEIWGGSGMQFGRELGFKLRSISTDDKLSMPCVSSSFLFFFALDICDLLSVFVFLDKRRRVKLREIYFLCCEIERQRVYFASETF
jgi:hypothetical protein